MAERPPPAGGLSVKQAVLSTKEASTMMVPSEAFPVHNRGVGIANEG